MGGGREGEEWQREGQREEEQREEEGKMAEVGQGGRREEKEGRRPEELCVT